MDEDFFDYIFKYTRQEAIHDNVLIDISEIAYQFGYKIPVAMTVSIWCDFISSDSYRIDEISEKETDSLINLLLVLFKEIKLQSSMKSELHFSIDKRINDEGIIAIFLKAMIHPGDNHEPVITIMYPHED